jgi:hypothetical protein
LFSAAVASLISVSIQDLQQNPQDTSNFYLANMYQAAINPNGSSALPVSPPPFTPPNFAIWVNTLWFLSLVISITCALLATLLQQWARRYLKVTQPRYSLHKRARIRAFFAEGVDKFLLPWAVEALPAMLHLSLFLFFAGLAVFLWNVNLTIFKLVLSWVGLCTALYGCITFVPVFCHDSPYHTPLSLPAWHFIMGMRFLTLRAVEGLTSLDFFGYDTYVHFLNSAERCGKSLLQGMRKIAEESALRSPPEIDTRAFMWTFDCLDEDHELERFFAGLPGFRGSKVVKDPLPSLTSEQQGKLLSASIGLLDHTFSSDLLPEPVKTRRTVICRKAISPADIPRAIQWVLDQSGAGDQYGPVESAEIMRFARGWDDGRDVRTTTMVRAILSSVVAKAHSRDDLWFAMASDEMGVQESVLRNHATHGNNLSFAILNHLIRRQFSHFQTRYWPSHEFSLVLKTASKFDVLDTSPELQHDFCALWNEIVSAADRWISLSILRLIRNIYLTLHLLTDSAPTAFSPSTDDDDDILWNRSTYPLCNVPGHHLYPAAYIHDVSASEAIPHSALHDNYALVPTFPLAMPSPFVTAPVRVDDNPMDAPQLDNTSAPASLHRTHQMATELVHYSSVSPNLAASGEARNNPSARTIPVPSHETSTSAPSILLPVAVSLQDNTGRLVHSGAQETLSSASPEVVLDDITGPSLLTTHLLS